MGLCGAVQMRSRSGKLNQPYPKLSREASARINAAIIALNFKDLIRLKSHPSGEQRLG
jgi:hypothetical protein